MQMFTYEFPFSSSEHLPNSNSSNQRETSKDHNVDIPLEIDLPPPHFSVNLSAMDEMDFSISSQQNDGYDDLLPPTPSPPPMEECSPNISGGAPPPQPPPPPPPPPPVSSGIVVTKETPSQKVILIKLSAKKLGKIF